MLIPTEQVPQIKGLLTDLGVKWSQQIEPNQMGPVCQGFFRGNLVAIFTDTDDAPISEVKCLDAAQAQAFEDLLQSFMQPVEEEEES